MMRGVIFWWRLPKVEEAMFDVKRREFIALLGRAAASSLACSVAAGAQQPMPLIGFLRAAPGEHPAHHLAAFRKGLSETGYMEGRNVAFEFRTADGQNDRLPALAAELARRPVAVILTLGSTPAALAAKGATSTIPIVFDVGTDPVKIGLVASLNRPGGNLTGFAQLSVEGAAKRLQMLRDLLPTAKSIALLVNQTNPVSDSAINDVQVAAHSLRLTVQLLKASTESDIDAVFATLASQPADALYVDGDQFFFSRRVQLAALAKRHAVPAIYGLRDYAEAGGLMSYGPPLADNFRYAGIYTGRILKGEKPADLPVVRPTRIELVINLKTAKALGIAVPPSLLASADEVIE
jgi:putative ABC transport system substrate-binding protein